MASVLNGFRGLPGSSEAACASDCKLAKGRHYWYEFGTVLGAIESCAAKQL